MSLKHIDRDHFRHLTGLGRDFATFVEQVLGQWHVDNDEGDLPTGNLQVLRHDANTFSTKFIPTDVNLPDETPLGDYPVSNELMLSLITRQCGLCEVVSLPLLLLLHKDFSTCYQVYQHQFVEDGKGQPIANACYTGVTKRGWRMRWTEHLRAANSGSHYRFHRAIRDWQGVASVVQHTILAVCTSEAAAMAIEEGLVERDSLYPFGLNMVPGGNKGLAYLRAIGALGANERVAPDDRQDIINRFFERATRKGLPNPLAAANWLDANYAERVICSGPDRLKAQQIRDARFFASLGQDASAITARIGARNIEQVQRLLAGSTYSRVV